VGFPKKFCNTFYFSQINRKGISNKHSQAVKNVNGDNAVDKSTVSRCASRIVGSEKGQVELSDAPCSGRPTTAVTLALLQCADELLRNDRWITTRKLATELSVSKGSVNNIIDALRYAKMCARWVPRSLTDDHKTLLKEVCSYLLSCYEADGESFLSRIVTGDETWSHHFEPETRNQSVEWHHPTSPRKKKFMVTPSAGKVMATVFWDAEGVILVDIMPHGQIINSDLYFQTLKNLQKHLRRVQPHKIVAEILQHYNARLHTQV
jgi:hypothetical protein